MRDADAAIALTGGGGRHAAPVGAMLAGDADPTRRPEPLVRIRALSVFEGVVYHSWCVDPSQPCRPTLEVEALLRPGDADSGPLLLPVADYVVMAGGREVAEPCLRELEAKGRITTYLDVPHLVFPTWTRVVPEER